MKRAVALGMHPGEWIAMRVTRVDRADVPLEGEVIAHAPDRGVVHAMASRFRERHPRARLFIFFSGDPIPQGLVVSLVAR